MTLNQESFDNAELDLTTISEVANVNYSGDSTTNREGTEIATLLGQLKQIGYLPPVAYGGGISFLVSDTTKTIERTGVIYAPNPTDLPFTTTGTWGGDDEYKFFVVQGTNLTDGSVTLAKLAPIVASNIYMGLGTAVGTVSVNGHVSMDSTGTTTINNGVIEDAMHDPKSITNASIEDETVTEALLSTAVQDKLNLFNSSAFKYKAGMEISNNSVDTEHDIDIAVGIVQDINSAVFMNNPSVTTIEIDGAIGAGNGGFPTSYLTLQPDTLYRVFVVADANGENQKFGFDIDSIADNVINQCNDVYPETYTTYRRLGWIETDASSNISNFYQNGNKFTRGVLTVDLDQQGMSGSDSSRVAVAIGAPPNTMADNIVILRHTTTNGTLAVFITSSSQPDSIPNASTRFNTMTAARTSGGQFPEQLRLETLTDSSRQIYYRGSSGITNNTNLTIKTLGWTDLFLD